MLECDQSTTLARTRMIYGPVTLKGLNEGTRDMSKYKWSYKKFVRILEGFLLLRGLHSDSDITMKLCVEAALCHNRNLSNTIVRHLFYSVNKSAAQYSKFVDKLAV
uniref:Uncharacterized protein n=1 Tax=Cucumis melo TaxID=3656 RepID=A0A9I9E688_CUCME